MEDYIVYPLKVRLKQLVYLAANVADSSRENTSSGTQSVNIVYMISKLALLLQSEFLCFNVVSKKHFIQQARHNYSSTFVSLKSPHGISKNVYIEKKMPFQHEASHSSSKT